MANTPTFQHLLDRMPARVAHFRIAQNLRRAREKDHVLVVEDQLFSRMLLHETLQHDYSVDLAGSARDGLNLFLENAPNIVFLDIELLDESGHSLARAFRTLDPSVAVVMVTANNSPEDVALAKSNRVDGFIVKPYSRQKVFEVLDKIHTSGTQPLT